MKILSIDTSCDETSVAITEDRKVIANVIYSQILLHKKWGGVVPSIAKRAHEEKIDLVVDEALKKSKFDYVAVTQGPGLAVALEVGIKKAKEIAVKFNKKLIAVNHMEGHIYSCFVQNSRGNPNIEFKFPYIALLISGGHTEIVLFKNHLDYEISGTTIDDAAGEALDKAAKMLGLGYPGGPTIEKLAHDAGNTDEFKFPRPMLRSNDFNFSFSGLKTSFYYFLMKMKEEEKRKKLEELVSAFQEAVFDTLIKKTEKAVQKHNISRLAVGGGVIANLYLRKQLKNMISKYQGEVFFPPFKYLTGDNASMIGVAAYFKAKKGDFVKDLSKLDRLPRMSL